MNTLEWDGIEHNERTKRGDIIMRLSKNGNIRIVYRQFMVQGRYAIERRVINQYGDLVCWDRYKFANYSSDVLSEVEHTCKYMPDEPQEVEQDG